MTNTQIRAVAAVIGDGQGRYLMGRRKTDRIAGGKWEFPGGKVEAGENLREALKREIWEELGDQVEIGNLVCSTINHDYPWGKVTISFFAASLSSHHLKQVAASEFIWDTPEKLLQLDVLPASRSVLEELNGG
ncbi:MAG: (deoxy)nucleoside triphosphate pyrophosphohydrolase [Ligilactobacillus sp.]|uniref:8-oxo-dGTP diphosphatase n=1 Tax=Ligilactobacillus equi DPC 6820 TaxID=1392007 RepID=V7HWW6_9LACO|nr:(deoxy)nucleoside triphosphate pyrophosphohydrolase [Ligilactobacillus equi]ETA73708.1 radical SAM domain-containing protein [Ligilactobacillus equi DPC 6820]MCQ2556496.1 (deoxy)nucleoside triphosphate pyrophosphohydrolase [Ligilactobacillus sp.]